MRKDLSSAAEAKLGPLFHNGKEACPLCITLDEMVHPQPATPIATDNSTPATGITNDTVKQNDPKPLTCASTGFAIAYAKANSKSTGAKAATTELIILRSITHQLSITKQSAPTISILPTIQPKTILIVSTTPHMKL
jgi:hypothetical protein